jgi:CspA family cold shock protein
MRFKELAMRMTIQEQGRFSLPMKGTIQWFSKEKGYGFIDGNDGVRRFFHVADTAGDFTPEAGNFILFEPRQDRKGPRAVSVRLNPDSLVEIKRPLVRNGRMSCPHCGTAIVPRVVFNYGAPIYSICQFCGGKVADFREPSQPWVSRLFAAILGSLTVTILLALLLPAPLFFGFLISVPATYLIYRLAKGLVKVSSHLALRARRIAGRTVSAHSTTSGTGARKR